MESQDFYYSVSCGFCVIDVNIIKGDKEGHVEGGERELMRSTDAGKEQQVANVEAFSIKGSDPISKSDPTPFLWMN